MTATPLVSCIMPTHDRRGFVPLAIDYFLRQDYEAKELVVVDDGNDVVKDLIPDDPRVRYLRLDGPTALGAKRNLACKAAEGDLIVHWDDDDWSASWRLSYQVDAIVEAGAQVCGLRSLLFYEPQNHRGWRYTYPNTGRPWVAGGTLCYRRDLWERHHFPEIRQGEDTQFQWISKPEPLIALENDSFYLALIHAANTSPKRTSGRRWTKVPGEDIVAILGEDAVRYGRGSSPSAGGDEAHGAAHTGLVPDPTSPRSRRAGTRSGREAPPVRNVFACLVHEQPAAISDLARNLRHLDPSSQILLYNGSSDPTLLDRVPDLDRLGVAVHPYPRPMRWGELHGFAVDAMEYALAELDFDTFTIVDSDQLGLRPGYSDYLAAFLSGERNVGILGKDPSVQTRPFREGPARAAVREAALWKPYLSSLPAQKGDFPYWTFWPSTVFTAPAAHDIVERFRSDADLKEIMERSRIWATEEVILPSLTVALGYRYLANPCSYDFVRYRAKYSIGLVDRAWHRDDVYWIHPIERSYANQLRQHIRLTYAGYRRTERRDAEVPANDLPKILRFGSILERMRPIEGWLDDDEAELLMGATLASLRDVPEGETVEVGSYCGRSTVVMASVIEAFGAHRKLHAIDPHDGRVGSKDDGIREMGKTLAKFKRNLKTAGLSDYVKMIRQRSTEVAWDSPVGLLFVDGLHDFESVSSDLEHFDPWVLTGGYVAFHDYADYYPGVMALVDGLIADGRYRMVERAASMVLLQKTGRTRVE